MMIRTPNAYDDFSDCVLTCKGEHIELVQHAKYLGIFIHEHLHFHHQVKYVADSMERNCSPVAVHSFSSLILVKRVLVY